MINAARDGFKILFIPIIAVIILLILGLIFNIIRQRNLKGLIYKKIDISHSKIDTLKTILSKYDRFYKIINYKNVLVFMTEYNISIGLLIEETGSIRGKENDKQLEVSGVDGDKVVENEIPLLLQIKKDIESYLNKKIENVYIISGDNCMLFIELTNIKEIKTNEVFFKFAKKDTISKYSKEELEELSNNLEKQYVK